MKEATLLIMGFMVGMFFGVMCEKHRTNPSAQSMLTMKSIAWQWDDIRENNRLADVQSKFAEQFYKTNTNPTLGAIMNCNYPSRIPSGRELGFCSDGTIVWRNATP